MRLALLALPLFLLACSTPDPPSPTTVPASNAAEQPVTVEGQRGGNSRPFTLQGGHYTARWEAHSLTSGMCFHLASLRPLTPNKQFITATLGTAQVPGDGTSQTGETQVYNVPPGEYYVSSSSACGWTITLSPFR
jgi:hypothetical protein